MLVDIAGARAFVKADGRLAHGGAAWRGGAVVAGHDGLAILGADGAMLAQSKGISVPQRPVTLASALAAPPYDGDIAIFDDTARVIQNASAISWWRRSGSARRTHIV